jgi:tetratricopeptide (TPR) repeat protein
LRLFFWPYPLDLIHPFREIESIFQPQAFFSVAGIILILLAIVILRKRNPILSFGLSWYIIGLIPKFYARLNILAAEHQFYLSSFGIYLILFLILEKIYLRYKRYILCFCLGTISIFTLLVWIRNYEWSDTIRFWEVSLRRNPKGVAWHNLAVRYKELKDFNKAEEYLRKALAFAIEKKNKRGEAVSRANLAVLYLDEGRIREAKEMAEEALKKEPDYFLASQVLGKILLKEKREEEALDIWNKALEKFPYAWGIYECLASFYLEKGDLKNAELNSLKAIEYNPESWYAYLILGKIQEEKDIDSAIDSYKRAVNIEPENQNTHFSLATAYIKKRQYIEAIGELEETLKINPNFAPAYYNLSLIYLIFDQRELAISYLNRLKNWDTK